MNDYAKKILATVLFSLLFTGGGKNVNSMECIEEKIEQVNVKSTTDLVNKFEKLNDASDYFKKTFPENWKNYLDLYNKCFKKLSNKKADYIKNITEFEKMHNSGVRNNGNLVEYGKVLTENIEYVDKMIKELYKKIDEKFGKLPKVGFFASLFTKQDDHTLLVNYVNKLSEDHRKTKREIAEKVGILTKKSINRNILQASDNSPLKKLEKLYNALQQSSGEFTFEQNLLNVPKTLDINVENSLQKIVGCKWEKVDSLKEMLDFYDNLEKLLNGLDKNSVGQSSGLKNYATEFENLNSIDGFIKLSTKVKEDVRKMSAKKGNNLAIKLYLKVLSYREQCRTLGHALN
jgi:hypothetical protein